MTRNERTRLLKETCKLIERMQKENKKFDQLFGGSDGTFTNTMDEIVIFSIEIVSELCEDTDHILSWWLEAKYYGEKCSVVEQIGKKKYKLNTVSDILDYLEAYKKDQSR